MKILTTLFVALGALSASALDLTPSFAEVSSDGVTIRRPYFTDGGKKYSVTINAETEVTQCDEGALFRFIKLKNAEMRLRPSPCSVEIKFEPETLDSYEAVARKLLPQVAEGVVLEQQTGNPLPINGWEGHRFVYTYSTPAGQVRESITFLNILPAHQVIVQIYAPAKEFSDASERGFDIIRRWHELDTALVLRGN